MKIRRSGTTVANIFVAAADRYSREDAFLKRTLRGLWCGVLARSYVTDRTYGKEVPSTVSSYERTYTYRTVLYGTYRTVLYAGGIVANIAKTPSHYYYLKSKSLGSTDPISLHS